MATKHRQEDHVSPGVIERLRRSKLRSDKAFFEKGYQRGQEWARRWADWDDLSSIEQFYESLEDESGGGWREFFESSDSVYSPLERFAFAVRPDCWRCRWWAESFLQSVIGELTEEVYQPEFLRGLCKGAVDVLEKVQEEL